MKFRIVGHGWPVRGGSSLVPAGAVLDRDDWQWQGAPLPWSVPINAQPLDADAFNALCKLYPEHRHYLMPVPPAAATKSSLPSEDATQQKRRTAK